MEMKNVLDRASEEHGKRVKQVCTLKLNCYEEVKWSKFRLKQTDKNHIEMFKSIYQLELLIEAAEKETSEMEEKNNEEEHRLRKDKGKETEEGHVSCHMSHVISLLPMCNIVHCRIFVLHPALSCDYRFSQ